MQLLRRLSRITSSGRFIPEIDGLRFIAISSVFLFHLYGFITVKLDLAPTDLLAQIISHGDFGVPLFFVISGFILCLPFAEGHLGLRPVPSLRKYFVRRVTRLEPPYIINLILCTVLTIIVLRVPAAGLLKHSLASLFYLHNMIYGVPYVANTVALSLEVEVQFYIFAPLLAHVFLIRRKYIRRSLLACSILAGAVGSLFLPEDLRYGIIRYAQYFLAGFLLADIYIVDWSESPQKCSAWDFGTLFGALSILAILVTGGVVKVLLPFAVLLAYSGVFRGRYASYLLTRPAITTIGGMCYTIYLYHFYVISAVGRVLLKVYTPAWSFWGYYALLFVIIGSILIVTASILFVLFEQPFMRRDWLGNLLKGSSKKTS